MLDVHPPEHTPHTWRDFFIHIATIVVGLCIAVGLEQTVEYIHRRHELRETLESLKAERNTNIKLFHVNVREERYGVAFLENDLRLFQYLQQHPGAPMDNLPGLPEWGVPYESFVTNAWHSAVQSNVVARMPSKDVAGDQQLYELFATFQTSSLELWQESNKASQYEYTQPDPGKLTQAEITHVIDSLRSCLRLQYVTLISLENIARNFDDFKPGPTEEELNAMQHYQSFDDQKRLYPHAYAAMLHDVETAKAYDKAHTAQPPH